MVFFKDEAPGYFNKAAIGYPGRVGFSTKTTFNSLFACFKRGKIILSIPNKLLF
jgi:hypothetical protein